MNRAIAALRLLRAGVHGRAYALQRRGRGEAADALWALVEVLDELLNLLTQRRGKP